MSTERDYFQNPGPWHMYPGSNHVVDADGNTVCTIAPDCSKDAIAIICKAPELFVKLREISGNLSFMMAQDASPSQEEADNLQNELNEILEFIEQFKTPCYDTSK